VAVTLAVGVSTALASVDEPLSHEGAEPVQAQVPGSTGLGGDTTTCFALGAEQRGSASSDSQVVLLTNARQCGPAFGLPGRTAGLAGR
jgi:hypothetical protein